MPTLPTDVANEVIPRLAAAKQLVEHPPEGLDDLDLHRAISSHLRLALYWLDAGLDAA